MAKTTIPGVIKCHALYISNTIRQKVTQTCNLDQFERDVESPKGLGIKSLWSIINSSVEQKLCAFEQKESQILIKMKIGSMNACV